VSSVGKIEPAFSAAMPIRDARWRCTAGDSDVCSGDAVGAPTDPTGDPNNINYSGLTLGSNGGQCVTLFAPAKNIPVASIYGTNVYRDSRASGGQASGTSWSAPIVAGVVARMLGSNQNYSVDDVYTDLMANHVDTNLLDTTALNPPNVTNTPNKVLRGPDVNIGQLPATSNGPITAFATGTLPLAYQWYQVDPGFNVSTYHSGAAAQTPVPGAISAILSSPAPGTSYFVRVTSACGSADSNITTAASDLPPIASFTISCTGTTCTADASASSDDHRIVSYAWTINGVPNGVTGPTWTATLSTGKKTVKLHVSDTIGQVGSVEQKFTVTQ
jgi:hypothetical protein